MDPSPTRPSHRSLRLTPLLAWPFAFALCLPHGLKTGQVLPALGILPATISALYALTLLRKRDSMSRSRLAVMEFVLCLAHLAILIPSWIGLAVEYSYRAASPGTMMLGSYATVPLMWDLAVHAYSTLITLPYLISILHSSAKPPNCCPNCHIPLPAPQKPISLIARLTRPTQQHITLPVSGPSNKEYYAPLTADYDDHHSDETVQADAYVFPPESEVGRGREGSGSWEPRDSSEIETTPRPSQETLASVVAGKLPAGLL